MTKFPTQDTQDRQDTHDSSSFNSIGREESKILGLKGILVGEFWCSGLRLRFSSEGRVVNLELPSLDDPKIRRHPVSKFDFNDISKSKLRGGDSDFLSVSSCKSILGHEVLE